MTHVPVTSQSADSTGKIDVLGVALQPVFAIDLLDLGGLITQRPLFSADAFDDGYAFRNSGLVLCLGVGWRIGVGWRAL